MPPTTSFLRRELSLAPTLLQRQFAGRLLCVVVAAPLTLLVFSPVLLQTTRIW